MPKQMLQRPTTAALYFQISSFIFLGGVFSSVSAGALWCSIKAAQDKKQEENNDKRKTLFGSTERHSFHEDCWVQLLPPALFQVCLRKKRAVSLVCSETLIFLLGGFPAIKKLPLRRSVKVWDLHAVL